VTVANWIAVLLPIVGLVGGAIVYQVQKTIDRANQLRAERRDLYRQLVSTFNLFNAAVLLGKNEEALEQFIAYKGLEAELLVCAPDGVVNALKPLSKKRPKYSRAYRMGEEGKKELFQEVKDALDSAIEQMRIDVLGSTILTKAVLREFSQGFVQSLGRLPL
jgi:hypothetical protein